MRKVLSFVLVLSLVLGSLGMAFAAMPDVKGEDFEDAVNVLTDLGVVSGYPDGTYRPDNIVTRAEMAVFIVNALGLSDYATGTSSFKDMAGHWSNKYVAYATSLGIIDGYPDGTFRPDKTVSYDEAAKMLVAALGYTPDSLVGTWPANYVTKAKALKILDGIVAGSAGANRGDIATMVFQTLDCKIGTVTKEGEWKANDPVERMIDRLGGQDYKPATASAGAAFVLTNEHADAAKVNVRHLVGAYVTAYANSSNKIIGVKEVLSEFLDGEMNAANDKFETDDAAYYVSRLPATFSAVYFYNGIVSGAGIEVSRAAIADGVYAVDLDGLYIDEVYSFSEWELGPSKKVAKADIDEIAKDDKILGKALPTDSKDNVDTSKFELVGVDSLSEIVANNVVYVYYSDKAEYVTKVEVGTEIVEGMVSKKSGEKYTIDGKVYEPASGTLGLNVKDEVKLWLDVNGDIFEAKKITGEADNYAIVLDYEYSAKSLLKGNSVIELFLADGTVKQFTVDNDELTNASFGAIVTPGQIDVGRIVKYGLNSDGELTDITYAAMTAGVDKAGTNFTANGTYDGKNVADDAVIFTATTIGAVSKTTGVAVEAEDDDDYGITTKSKLLGVKDVQAAYYYKDGKIVFMVVKDDASSASDDKVYGMFVSHALTAADPGAEFKLLVKGAEETYAAVKTATGSTAGALYLLKFNAKDEISSLDDAAKNWEKTNIIKFVTIQSITVSDNVATVTATGGGITVSGVYTTNTALLTLASDVVVYKTNSAGTKWVAGSESDLRFTSATNKVVVFYDLYGNDKIVDVVVIAPNAFANPAK